MPTGAAALESDSTTDRGGGGVASLNRDSLKTRMDRVEHARLPHTERQSRLARPSSATLAVGAHLAFGVLEGLVLVGTDVHDDRTNSDRFTPRHVCSACEVLLVSCQPGAPPPPLVSDALSTRPVLRVIPTTMACPVHETHLHCFVARAGSRELSRSVADSCCRSLVAGQGVTPRRTAAN